LRAFPAADTLSGHPHERFLSTAGTPVNPACDEFPAFERPDPRAIITLGVKNQINLLVSAAAPA
jgi:hypothetical protein